MENFPPTPYAGADNLPDFIDQNREAILQEWDIFARSLDTARLMSPDGQRDHAAQMLVAIANDMRTPQNSVSQEQKSKGRSHASASALQSSGQEHATARIAEQFSLSELVSEFRAIRASVLRLWARKHPIAADRLNDVVRFNESIDELLAASSQSYATRIDESRDVIIGILAHDLRNPIHSVMLGTRYLLESRSTDTNGIKAVARMQRAASRMSELVNNLLDYARTSLGDTIPVFPKPTALNAICHRAIEEVESTYPDRSVTLVSAEEVTGTWDASRIIQLLTNLLINALQHGEADGVVSVTVSGTASFALIQVHNSGEPIDPTAFATLFDPLYRRANAGESTSGAKSSGLGLGLFIARQIALAHGGDIKVASTRVGGTVFSIELPKSFSRSYAT